MSEFKKTAALAGLLAIAFSSRFAISDGTAAESSMPVPAESRAMVAAKSRICETSGKSGEFLFLYRKGDGEVGVGVLNGTGSESAPLVATVSGTSVSVRFPNGSEEVSTIPGCVSE